MKEFKVLLALLLIMGLPSTFAMKIGTVDVQKVLLSINEGKRVRKQLKKMFDQRQAKIKKEEKAIRKMQKNFEKQSAVMNDKAKFKKEREIQGRVLNLQQSVVKHQQEIRDEENRRKKPIMANVKSIIDKIGKNGKYDLVFEVATAPVYIKSASDVTNKVVKAYNKKFK